MRNIIKKFLQPYTLQIKPKNILVFCYPVLALILLLLASEILLRLLPVLITPPVLTLGKDSNQIELDIKIQRLETLAKKTNVDCFFIGNSMVEAGFEPEVFVSNIKGMDKPLTCFNLGLSSAKVGTIARLAKYLTLTYHPKVIFYGANLIDYTPLNKQVKFPDPWLLYKTGNFTWEGFLVDSSWIYRYLVTIPKIEDSSYMALLNQTDQLITANGFRDKLIGKGPRSSHAALAFTNLNVADFTTLKTITDLNNKNTHVIVVEMPVSTTHFPEYIPAGETVYNNRFLLPLAGFLKSQGIPFWRSLPEMNTLISSDGWYNGEHLNKNGAEIFSSWLSVQYSRFLEEAGKPG
jgi:hypothetical protein